MKPTHLAQHGFAAIAAIFLVLVLAAFGAFMVSFSNTQHLNTARDVQGSRAYWAARAGEGHAFGSHTFDHVYFSAPSRVRPCRHLPKALQP